MSGTYRSQRLQPDELSRALDRWAFRREKVLALLDVRAAREARTLAARCRVLGAMAAAPEDRVAWDVEWRAVRQEVVELLSRVHDTSVLADHASAEGRADPRLRREGPPSIPPGRLDWSSFGLVSAVRLRPFRALRRA